MINSPRVRILLVSVVAIVLVATAVWVLQRRSGHYATDQATINPAAAPPENTVQRATPDIAASPLAQTTPGPSPSNSPANLSSASPSPSTGEAAGSLTPLSIEPSYVGKLNLIVPVVGVRAEQLLDTFKDARSEGRVHDAIDIPAPAGTPVVAAADGEVIKLFQSDRGGTTIYQLSADKKLIFYYAHLQRYADGLSVGKFVRQGELIGYVGDTGNAGPGNYHLHFSIAIVADPKRYWEGTNINPYPLLRK